MESVRSQQVGRLTSKCGKYSYEKILQRDGKWGRVVWGYIKGTGGQGKPVRFLLSVFDTLKGKTYHVALNSDTDDFLRVCKVLGQ